MYRHLRGETFPPEPFIRFVERYGQPALELGCGDGDPLLDLVAAGLDVEGLDASADMLDRCCDAAAARGLDVVLHHARFESMDLGRRYRSIYLAGATFNLIPDDDGAQAALNRIAAHLDADGVALVPLFIPAVHDAGAASVRSATAPDGSTLRLTTLAVDVDRRSRTMTTTFRYEMLDAAGHVVLDSADREWLIHWHERDSIVAMAERAGLRLRRLVEQQTDLDGTENFALMLSPA